MIDVRYSNDFFQFNNVLPVQLIPHVSSCTMSQLFH